MTEPELVEATTAFLELSMTTMAMYVTVTSGYLITAFVAGTRLLPLQVFIVSVLFVLVGSLSAFGTVNNLMRGLNYSMVLEQVAPDRVSVGPTAVFVPAVAAALVGGILVSLYFMWSIRRRAAS